MSTKFIVVSNYMDMLEPMSNEMKIELIKDLIKSLTTKNKKSKLESLFGAWKDDKSAEELIELINHSRLTGTRNIESL